jgi:hypothetical protein
MIRYRSSRKWVNGRGKVELISAFSEQVAEELLAVCPHASMQAKGAKFWQSNHSNPSVDRKGRTGVLDP